LLVVEVLEAHKTMLMLVQEAEEQVVFVLETLL